MSAAYCIIAAGLNYFHCGSSGNFLFLTDFI